MTTRRTDVPHGMDLLNRQRMKAASMRTQTVAPPTRSRRHRNGVRLAGGAPPMIQVTQGASGAGAPGATLSNNCTVARYEAPGEATGT